MFIVKTIITYTIQSI